MNSPNRSIPLVPENALDPAAGLNDAIQVIDALLQTAVISMSLTTPPGTSSDGDLYIVASPATGAWAGHENDLARYVDDGNFWLFYTAGSQVSIVLNQDDGGLYAFDTVGSPGSWVLVGGAITVEDTDSPATTATNVSAIVFGTGFTVTELTGGVVQVDGGGGSAESGRGTLTTVSIASNTINIDHSLGADFDLQLTANVNTVNHNNLGAGQANWFTMRVRQDGTGGRTFSPPASWKYASGVSAYTASSGASDVDLINGVTYDDGTTWMITYQKDFA